MVAGDSVVIEQLRVVRGGKVVLPDLSISIAKARVTGLLGPNGSGKTTLMRAIVGVQRVLSGKVTVLGLPAGSPSLRARVGYVTQAPSVYGDLTVVENLRYFARLLGASQAAIAKTLTTVGLTGYERHVVNRLSGGEQARVSLATALLNEPELLVLDEPSVGLDPVLRQDLWATFRTLAGSGTTLLISSHVMEEAANCDELLLLRDGRIVAAATPAEIRTWTATDDLGEAFLRLVAPERA